MALSVIAVIAAACAKPPPPAPPTTRTTSPPQTVPSVSTAPPTSSAPVAAPPVAPPAPPAAAGARSKDSARQILARAEALLVAEDYRGASEAYAAFLAVNPGDGAAPRIRATRTVLDRLFATQADVQRLQRLQRESGEVQAELQRLRRDAATRDGELTRLRRDLAAQQTELEQLKTDLERLKSIDLRPEQRRR